MPQIGETIDKCIIRSPIVLPGAARVSLASLGDKLPLPTFCLRSSSRFAFFKVPVTRAFAGRPPALLPGCLSGWSGLEKRSLKCAPSPDGRFTRLLHFS